MIFALHILAQPVYSLLPASLERAGTLFIVLSGTLFGFAHLAVSRGTRAALTMMMLCLIVAGGFEMLSVGTGFPFGQYRYSSLLGPGILGVPLLVPFCWQLMAHNANTVARHIAPRWHVPVAALTLTAWDVYIDPQNVRAGYWTWARHGEYVGIPLENFAGWFLTALIIFALYAWLERNVLHPRARYSVVIEVKMSVQSVVGATEARKPLHPYSPRDDLFELLPVFVYIWMWFGSAVVNLFWWGQPIVALAGFVCTGAFAVPAIRSILEATRAGRLRWDRSSNPDSSHTDSRLS